MHTTIVHPDGTVEVLSGEDAAEPEVAQEAVSSDPVSDALDVLDGHFTDSITGHMLDYLRGCRNEELWTATGNQGCAMTCDPPSLNLGEAAMLRG